MSRASIHSEAPPGDPVDVFSNWYDDAVEAGAPFADAFALATATRDGRPAVRYVLFKGIADGKLRFVTNFESRKARELFDNARAALAFFWPVLGRQVRMEGSVARAADAESDRYFSSRDRETQLGAWASPQSRMLDNRAELDAALEAARSRFEGREVPRPAHWGMLLFTPDAVELWKNGVNRLHDRFSYRRDGSGWRAERLAP